MRMRDPQPDDASRCGAASCSAPALYSVRAYGPTTTSTRASGWTWPWRRGDVLGRDLVELVEVAPRVVEAEAVPLAERSSTPRRRRRSRSAITMPPRSAAFAPASSSGVGGRRGSPWISFRISASARSALLGVRARVDAERARADARRRRDVAEDRVREALLVADVLREAVGEARARAEARCPSPRARRSRGPSRSDADVAERRCSSGASPPSRGSTAPRARGSRAASSDGRVGRRSSRRTHFSTSASDLVGGRGPTRSRAIAFFGHEEPRVVRDDLLARDRLDARLACRSPTGRADGSRRRPPRWNFACATARGVSSSSSIAASCCAAHALDGVRPRRRARSRPRP